eukprot:106363-Chlamydomonas_euryale.AAC.3
MRRSKASHARGQRSMPHLGSHPSRQIACPHFIEVAALSMRRLNMSHACVITLQATLQVNLVTPEA